jgi:hypothetical protein
MTTDPIGAQSAFNLHWEHGFSLDKSRILVNFELVQKGAVVSFCVVWAQDSRLQQLKSPVHTP